MRKQGRGGAEGEEGAEGATQNSRIHAFKISLHPTPYLPPATLHWYVKSSLGTGAFVETSQGMK
ncbi:hypothetical protein [Scytonema millei]|uniref:Uncharacterized protein n=1 Tax=Scytonema millei VB511283 TaxID=1245923 RepID=A0A9X5E4J1_9CYAN|nr:hypothetical protein [Scytonema millei]NHC34941.1 hypothetical protein [Scytonema millei VB511283]